MSFQPSELRPMGIGDILDETIRLYRRHFLLFVNIGARVLIPLTLVQLVMSLATPVPTTSDASQSLLDTNLQTYAGLACLSIIFYPVSLAATMVMSCAMILSAAEAYFGRRLTVLESYQRALLRFWPLLWLSILLFLAIMVVFGGVTAIPAAIYVALFQPFSPTPTVIAFSFIGLAGIAALAYLGTIWAFCYQTLLLEGLGVFRAMGRSMWLTRGHWWRAFGTLLLLTLLTLVISAIPSLVSFALGLVPFFLAPTLATVASIVSSLVYVAGAVIAQPVGVVGSVLLYFDLRTRREGFDLELLAQQTDVTPGPGPVAP